MKKNYVVLAAVMLVSFTVVPAWAGSNAQNGLVSGAIGGALLGQAIGRDTEATLIGTAVGGVLGYMVGNEHDRVSTVQYRTVAPAPRYRVAEPQCREAEVLAYVDGRPERIYTTVCLEHGEWVVPDSRASYERTVIIDRGHDHYYPPSPPGWAKHKHHKSKWQRPVAARCDSRDRYRGRDWNQHDSTRVNVIIR